MNEKIIDSVVGKVMGDAEVKVSQPEAGEGGARPLAQVLVTFFGKTAPAEEAGLYYGDVGIGVDSGLPQLTDGGAGLLDAAIAQISAHKAALIKQGVKDEQGRQIIVPGDDAA